MSVYKIKVIHKQNDTIEIVIYLKIDKYIILKPIN